MRRIRSMPREVRVRNYCWTLNNPTLDEALLLYFTEADDNVRYLCYQEEVGLHGTTHLQGYIELHIPLSITNLKQHIPAIERAHFESRRGSSAQAIAYCKKPDTAIPDSFEERGVPSAQGSRSDLQAVVSAAQAGARERQLAIEFPSSWIRYHRGIRDYLRVLDEVQGPRHLEQQMDVRVFSGVPGAGKTFEAQAICDRAHGGSYVLSRANCSGSGVVWFDGYSGEGALIIDDFSGWIQYRVLLGLLDSYRGLRLQIKGGVVIANWRLVIITSNTDWKAWFNRPDVSALGRRICISYWYNEPRQAIRYDPFEL